MISCACTAVPTSSLIAHYVMKYRENRFEQNCLGASFVEIKPYVAEINLVDTKIHPNMPRHSQSNVGNRSELQLCYLTTALDTNFLACMRLYLLYAKESRHKGFEGNKLTSRGIPIVSIPTYCNNIVLFTKAIAWKFISLMRLVAKCISLIAWTTTWLYCESKKLQAYNKLIF